MARAEEAPADQVDEWHGQRASEDVGRAAAGDGRAKKPVGGGEIEGVSRREEGRGASPGLESLRCQQDAVAFAAGEAPGGRVIVLRVGEVGWQRLSPVAPAGPGCQREAEDQEQEPKCQERAPIASKGPASFVRRFFGLTFGLRRAAASAAGEVANGCLAGAGRARRARRRLAGGSQRWSRRSSGRGRSPGEAQRAGTRGRHSSSCPRWGR